MTQQKRQIAKESWTYHRAALSRRSNHFPNLSIFLPLIDRICELGYSEKFYAGTSLDNLVISILPKPRDRRQTILVIPQENTVEFRLYPKEGEAEIFTVAPDHASSVLDHLLPRLAANSDTSSNGTVDGDLQT